HVTTTSQDLFGLCECFRNLSGTSTNDKQHVATRWGNLLRRAERNKDGIVFLVLTKEACLPFFEYADNLEVIATHANLSAGDIRETRKQRICCIDSNHDYVGSRHVILVANEATLFQRNVDDVRVVRRNTLSVTPAIVLPLVRYVVVERPATITDIRSDDSQIF